MGYVEFKSKFIRVLYYYIRSLSLLTDGYDEEAITAADNTVDVIFQAIKQRKQIPTKARIVLNFKFRDIRSSRT